MAIDKPKTNLYKIPHLSSMTYEDIKAFEQFGVTPKDPSRSGGAQDGQQEQPQGGD